MKKEPCSNLTLTDWLYGQNSSTSKWTPNDSLTPEKFLEIKIAIEAAEALAKRLKEDIAIQEDLSVVAKAFATKRILETIKAQ